MADIVEKDIDPDDGCEHGSWFACHQYWKQGMYCQDCPKLAEQLGELKPFVKKSAA